MSDRAAATEVGSAAAADWRQEIERLRAENAALRESEAMYRAATELSRRLVWSTDPDGKVLAVSEVFGRLTGVEDEQVLKAQWLDFVHVEDRPRVESLWRQAREEGTQYSCEYRGLLADGTCRYVRSRAMPAKDEQGRTTRWYGTTEDIHARREAELGRSEAEERYRLALRATNDVLWDYDVGNGTVEWSETASALFGCSGPLGTTPLSWWEMRIHPDDRARAAESLEEAVDKGSAHWSATYRFRKEDGTWADIFDRGFILCGADGKPVRAVGSMSDLTARNRAEAELRRVEGELAQVARLGAMGTMASTLAHEINQPLTAVSNYVRGARRMVADPGGYDREELAQALEAADKGAIRAGQIVRRLRELFSSGTVTMQRHDLAWLVEEAGGLAFLDEHQLGVSHRVDIDDDARFVLCDRIQIQQVLINLIRNAVQAMERSPVREVVIASRPAAADMVEVLVTDTGPGLDGGEDDIFSHFMTTKAGGMGLGLALSRTIVEAHGGKIWAQQRPEGGACFCFTLPRA
jgi:two-component system sensor kinase FixL